jgi:chorismate dehydratase
MSHLRVSAISYLNTAPLMWDFEHGDVGKDFEISYTLPSLCAKALNDGTADIGIIPAAAYASIPDLVILPEVAIASRQAVQSILLVSKVPLRQIQSVALDTSSLTSAALVKVLFARKWALVPAFKSAEPDLENMLSRQDAALMIGDPALKIDRSRYETWDLAEEWIRWTGKPFVFAFWAARREAIKESKLDLASIFQQSRDNGLTRNNIQRIVREWAPRLSVSEDVVRTYLTENIYYHLDAVCIEGLNLFYRYAAECRVLPAEPEIRFLRTANAAIV